MKKLSILVIFGIILFSCKKNETEAPDKNESDTDTKSYIQFRVANFVKNVEDISSARRSTSVINARDSSLHDKVQHIYYMLYDNDNQELINYRAQSYLLDSTSFGVYGDSLEQGSYVLIVAASQYELTLNAVHNPDSVALAGNYVNYPVELSPWADVFARKYAFEVGEVGDTVDIELNRIVGKLEVRLADATYPFYDISIEV